MIRAKNTKQSRRDIGDIVNMTRWRDCVTCRAALKPNWKSENGKATSAAIGGRDTGANTNGGNKSNSF